MWLVARVFVRAILTHPRHRLLRVGLLVIAACWSVFAVLVMRRYFHLGHVPEDGFLGIEFMYFGLPRWILCYLPGIVLLFTTLTTPRRCAVGDSGHVISTSGVIMGTTVLLLPLFGALAIKGWQVWRPYRDQRIDDYWKEVGADPSITWGSGEVYRLSYEEVTGARLAPVASVPHLQGLSCSDSTVGDDDLVHIRNLRELVELWLDGTKITDKGLEHVGKCRGLRTLGLRRTSVTGQGLSSLSELSSLESLWLSQTFVTDKGLAALQPLAPNLRNLYLEGTKISDDGLRHLSEFRHLDSLYLEGCDVSVEAVEELAESLPDCQIYFPGYKTRPRKRPMSGDGPKPTDQSFIHSTSYIHA